MGFLNNWIFFWLMYRWKEHTSFVQHIAQFAWHMGRNSEEEGISGATCKASSYCDSASLNCPSPNNLFPSNFAPFACSKAFCLIYIYIYIVFRFILLSCSLFRIQIKSLQVYFFWPERIILNTTLRWSQIEPPILSHEDAL